MSYPKNLEFYIDLAKKYSNSKTWKKNDYISYCNAQKLGFLKDCKKYMTPLWSRISVTKEEAIANARKYTYRTDWIKNNSGLVKYVIKNGWFDECVAHMTLLSKRYKNSWTKEELKVYADKYQTRSEWQYKHPASHRAAQRKGWLDELTVNYRTNTSSSTDELELLNKIKILYPTATKKRFGRPKRGEKANYFEIDIFIPELNLGIEFNGNYWHSFEGLKRKLVNWTDEEIRNYHNIKKQFFLDRNIQYFEVWEKDWKNNKEETFKKITSFLKGEKYE